MGPVKGSSQNPYQIAVLAGDGAGPSVAAAAVRVLEELTSYAEIHFDFKYADYGADAYEKSGKLVTPETLRICRESDAVLRSYQGLERGVGKDGSAHLQLRDELGLFAQFRPVIIYPALAAQSTLRKEIVKAVDIMLVREISAGALGAESITKEESEVSEIRYTKGQISAIANAALQVALQRNGNILNVDKADALSISRFWRRNVHETIEREAKGNDGILLTDMFVDDFVREVILRPGDFDVVVTSNLFGDILAEVIAALAGPSRYSPSFWVNREGLGVYGPADIYNASAYPDKNVEASPIALIRSASMMLKYALEEPAAANIIQQALRKSMEEIVGSSSVNGNGYTALKTSESTDIVTRSMQLMRQYEQVCDPTECGE
ncbi:3-isopropylmalate dehydrogenase [Gracilaria domingensis]|nr:3-isopropylmalate dehydrogenase [Gracilaria domingensis]